MRRLLAVLLPLLILSGCGALPAPDTTEVPETPAVQETPETPKTPKTGTPVYTDWSKLTPYEPARPVYTRHPGYCGDGALQAREDYGALLPYIGRYSSMERYVIDALPLFGLVTNEGALVSDPVYARISFFDGFLMLYRGDPEGTPGGDAYDGGTFSRTLAAADGRWVHELTDRYYVASGSGLLLTGGSGGALDLWNTEGEIVAHFDGAPFQARLGEDFTWGEEGGPYIDWTDDRVGYAVSYNVNGEYREEGVRLYLDFSTGAVTDTPPEGYPDEIDYEAMVDDTPEPPSVEGCNYLVPITDQVTGETCFQGYYRGGEDEDGSYALFDGEGRLLVESCGMAPFEEEVIIRAGLYSSLEDGCFCFRTLADKQLVFRYPMGTNSD